MTELDLDSSEVYLFNYQPVEYNGLKVSLKISNKCCYILNLNSTLLKKIKLGDVNKSIDIKKSKHFFSKSYVLQILTTNLSCSFDITLPSKTDAISVRNSILEATKICEAQLSNKKNSAGVLRAIKSSDLKKKLLRDQTTTATKTLRNLKASAESLIQLTERYFDSMQDKNDNETDELMNIVQDLGRGHHFSLTSKVKNSEYFQNLALEVDVFLEKVFEARDFKIITVLELYCLINKYRVFDRLSPEDLSKALTYFTEMNTKLSFVRKTFNPNSYFLTRKHMFQNYLQTEFNLILKSQNSFTLATMAQTYDLPIALVKNLADEAENSLLMLCRDETEFETYYYKNIFFSSC